MGGLEMVRVGEVFESNYIAPCGAMVERFEDVLAEHVGRPVVATASGTAALHLALRVLGVGPGDTVVCATLTFVASIAPAVEMGARPVFVECDPATWCMSPTALEEALAACAQRGVKPKAVVTVDLYGQTSDYDALEAVCGRYGVPLVVDAAEALGAQYKGRPAGAAGAAGFFSFNGNKVITTSGGGALSMADPALLARAKKLAHQAREAAAWYEHHETGYNYRLSNVLAGIGVGQMEQLAAYVEKRRQIFEWYREELAGADVAFMPEADYGRSSRWLTVVELPQDAGGKHEPNKFVRGVTEALDAANIESRPVWKPMHLQPVFKGCDCHGAPASETIFRRGLCLPSGTAMTRDDVAEVCGVVRYCLEEAE